MVKQDCNFLSIQPMKSKEIGNFGEGAVCRFLESKGYEIVKRNFTVRGGEIDIIARKSGVLAFVEVKTRKAESLTSGESAVTRAKMSHIIKAAGEFIKSLDSVPECRFDVAVVTAGGNDISNIKYYKGAFDASRQ